MPKIRTRKANIQDAISMSIIHANSWKKAYKSLLSDEYLDGIKDTRWVDMITKGLQNSSMIAWVATIEDKIIACTYESVELYEVIGRYCYEKNININNWTDFISFSIRL